MVNDEKRNTSKEKSKKKNEFPYKRKALREPRMNKRGGILSTLLLVASLIFIMILIWNFFGLELPSKPSLGDLFENSTCEELRECILLDIICSEEPRNPLMHVAQKQYYKEECLNQ